MSMRTEEDGSGTGKLTKFRIFLIKHIFYDTNCVSPRLREKIHIFRYQTSNHNDSPPSSSSYTWSEKYVFIIKMRSIHHMNDAISEINAQRVFVVAARRKKGVKKPEVERKAKGIQDIDWILNNVNEKSDENFYTISSFAHVPLAQEAGKARAPEKIRNK